MDLVIMMVGPGDVVRWLESGGVAASVPAPLGADALFAEHPERSYRWNRVGALALTEVLRRARWRVFHAVDRWDDAGRWMGRARESRRRAREVRRSAADPAAMLDAFELSLRGAVEFSLRRGARVMLVRQPSFRKVTFGPEEEALFWNGGIGNAARGDEVSVFFATEVLYDLFDRASARMACVAAASGVPYVDVSRSLVMSAATFFDHIHLTARGCAAFAKALAEAVVQYVAPPAAGLPTRAWPRPRASGVPH